MSYELSAAPVGFIPEVADLRDDGYYLDTYGLGPNELDQTISFNGHDGTVREMVDNPKCPVGGQLASAYAGDPENGVPGGFTAVEQKLTALEMLGVSITVSDQTRGFHAGTVSREHLLPSPPAAMEVQEAPFLV